MAESVRLEQSGDAFSDHGFHVSADDVKVFQPFKHQPGGGDVDVTVGCSGFSELEGQLIAIADYLVDVPLLLCEFSGGWIGPREVGGVVHVILRSRVDDHQFARFHNLVVKMVVQGLTMLCEDGGEGDSPSLCKYACLHLSYYILLDDSDLDAVPGNSMHLLSEGSGVIKLLYLTGFLDKPHRDDGLHEFLGSVAPSVLGNRGNLFYRLLGNAHEGCQFHGVVIP